MTLTLKRPHRTYYRKLAMGVRHQAYRRGYDPGPNPLAFSPDRPEERTMNWRERGAIILPCGFTVGESWASLRKSWLGYKSALRNGEADRLKMYAYNINKTQKQLGIPSTDFEVMPQEEFDRMEAETTGIGYELEKQQAVKVHEISREIGLNERLMDYDGMMHDAQGELGRLEPPRPEIFITYHPREDKACYVEEVGIPPPAVVAVHDTEACYYEYKPDSFKKKKKQQKRLRKSCYYVSHKPLTTVTENLSVNINRLIK